jgi:general secretion pathway protein E
MNVTPAKDQFSDRSNGNAHHFEKTLLAVLVADGLLDEEAAERAMRAYERTQGSLIDVLVRLGLCAERTLAQAVAKNGGWPLAAATDFPEEPIGLEALNVEFLRDSKVLPIAEQDEFVTIVAADPSDTFAQHALELVFGKPLRLAVAAGSDIEDAIARLYVSKRTTGAKFEIGPGELDVTEIDVARLRESASEAPIIRYAERLIARAVEAGASDIHIEPLERQLRVRLRVDGVLRDIEPAPISSAPAIVSRIKILARLDIAERRLPQDGSIKMNVRGREIDFRVATAPVAHGESVAVRILDRSSIQLDIAALGFPDTILASLKTILTRPNGIFLVTGPTGSGKSTTLYAGLNLLNTRERKIITIEDPVEYAIEGLNQIQVKPDIGLDFARALRSILRHDPDIVMVGEIRDVETARIATQAALTGHLVLSTLHTNDAPSAVTRLLDMGVDDYLVASTLSGVLAQRLARVLCTQCQKPSPAPKPVADWLEIHQVDHDNMHLFEASGCSACEGTGYRGRTVISELLMVDEAMRAGIVRRADAAGLRSSALASGMRPLYDDGMRRVIDGVTSYDELLRVAQDTG